MRRLALAALVMLPAAALGDDYLGILRVPPTFASGAYYSFASLEPPGLPGAATPSQRFKLGWKYSRYLAVEGDFSDYAQPRNPFANPAALGSPFRSTGFGLDTVATLPLGALSIYGRAGAYHGDRNGPISLAGTRPFDPTSRATRWRYGIGVRYDVTRSIGIQAEVERLSGSFTSPFAGDIDTDQFTLGVSWRF